MRCYDPLALVIHGPTIDVLVGHARTGMTQSVRALIDTGATKSCIDERLAKRLGLDALGKRMVGRVDGLATYDAYDAVVTMPALNLRHPGEFVALPLVEIGSCPVLLGRTFLRAIRMTYDGASGAVTLCLAQ